jgi:hypothetical protein
MLEAIRAGTILIRDAAVLPEALQYKSESYLPGWRSVQGLDGCALDRKIHDTGWHFFYFAGETRVTVFGGVGPGSIRKAIKRIIAGMKFDKSNSFEITRVSLKTFWGVPRTSVSFHRRNIQESMLLFGSADGDPRKDAVPADQSIGGHEAQLQQNIKAIRP